MRRTTTMTLGWMIALLATGSTLLQADTEPIFLRSLSTNGYRSVATRADGTALLVKRDGVILRDPAGGTRFVSRLRGNQRVSTAAGARVFGIATYADNAPSTLHVARFELLDSEGTRLWSITNPPASEFIISPTGEWTVGIGGGEGMHESELSLYDRTGNRVATWTVPYLSDLTLTTGSERFFAASRGELLAFPLAGGEAQNLGRYTAFGVSADGRWVALTGAGTLSVFDGLKLVFTVPTDFDAVRTLAVSPGGNYVALASGDRLEVFARESGAMIWTVSSGRPDLRFMSVAISDDPLRVLCGLDLDRGPETPNGQRHTRGAVFMLGPAGELLWREDLKYKSWNARVPRVTFADDHLQFEVELADERRQYALP